MDEFLCHSHTSAREDASAAMTELWTTIWNQTERLSTSCHSDNTEGRMESWYDPSHLMLLCGSDTTTTTTRPELMAHPHKDAAAPQQSEGEPRQGPPSSASNHHNHKKTDSILASCSDMEFWNDLLVEPPVTVNTTTTTTTQLTKNAVLTAFTTAMVPPQDYPSSSSSTSSPPSSNAPNPHAAVADVVAATNTDHTQKKEEEEESVPEEEEEAVVPTTTTPQLSPSTEPSPVVVDPTITTTEPVPSSSEPDALQRPTLEEAPASGEESLKDNNKVEPVQPPQGPTITSATSPTPIPTVLPYDELEDHHQEAPTIMPYDELEEDPVLSVTGSMDPQVDAATAGTVPSDKSTTMEQDPVPETQDKDDDKNNRVDSSSMEPETTPSGLVHGSVDLGTHAEPAKETGAVDTTTTTTTTTSVVPLSDSLLDPAWCDWRQHQLPGDLLEAQQQPKVTRDIPLVDQETNEPVPETEATLSPNRISRSSSKDLADAVPPSLQGTPTSQASSSSSVVDNGNNTVWQPSRHHDSKMDQLAQELENIGTEPHRQLSLQETFHSWSKEMERDDDDEDEEDEDEDNVKVEHTEDDEDPHYLQKAWQTLQQQASEDDEDSDDEEEEEPDEADPQTMLFTDRFPSEDNSASIAFEYSATTTNTVSPCESDLSIWELATIQQQQQHYQQHPYEPQTYAPPKDDPTDGAAAAVAMVVPSPQVQERQLSPSPQQQQDLAARSIQLWWHRMRHRIKTRMAAARILQRTFRSERNKAAALANSASKEHEDATTSATLPIPPTPTNAVSDTALDVVLPSSDQAQEHPEDEQDEEQTRRGDAARVIVNTIRRYRDQQRHEEERRSNAAKVIVRAMSRFRARRLLEEMDSVLFLSQSSAWNSHSEEPPLGVL